MTMLLRIVIATFLWLMVVAGVYAWANGRGDLLVPTILAGVAVLVTPKDKPVYL